MIRGRRCQRKKWQRPHAFIMPKANAGEVTNAFTSMMTKLPPPPRTRRRPTPWHQNSLLSISKSGPRCGAPWGFMFRRHVFSEAEYIEYICKKNSYKQLLTWAGIVDVRTDGTQGFLDRVYERNLPLVIENIGRKQKQSVAAKADPQAERKRKADEEASRTPTAATSSSAQAAASSGSAPFLMPEAPAPKSGAKPFLEPEVRPSPKASSSGHPDASWSWNRDHYGARREWSYWRGAWYFRDGAGGRWIYWNR